MQHCVYTSMSLLLHCAMLCTVCAVYYLHSSKIEGYLSDTVLPYALLGEAFGVGSDMGLYCFCRLSPYGEFGDVADDKPNATNRYLTQQLNNFGLAYLHMVEPRIAGNTEVEVSDSTFDLGHFRKLYNGTFIAAGMRYVTLRWWLAVTL